MADWNRRFFDPIELPNGRPLETLDDAAQYIIRLKKAESDLPEWQTAMQTLILCAQHGEPGADPFLARMGVMKALHRKVVREFNPDRKDRHWGKRKLNRDQ